MKTKTASVTRKHFSNNTIQVTAVLMSAFVLKLQTKMDTTKLSELLSYLLGIEKLEKGTQYIFISHQ